VFESGTHTGWTAGTSQVNHCGVVVFQPPTVDFRIAPIHTNFRGSKEVAHFPL